MCGGLTGCSEALVNGLLAAGRVPSTQVERAFRTVPREAFVPDGTAREVRRRYGRGTALLEQDHLRRVVLREHGSDHTPTVAPAFITAVTRAALDHGYHVVLEGILHTRGYPQPLRRLIAEHAGPTFAFWLEVSFEETLRRHRRRQEPIPVTDEQMRHRCSAKRRDLVR